MVVKNGEEVVSGARVAGSAVIDYLTDTIIYECKLTAAAVKPHQAEELARFAAASDGQRVLSYVFALRPTPEQLRTLLNAAQKVEQETGKKIAVYVGYLF